MANNYERKIETPEDGGSFIVHCKQGWVYDCPGCDELFAVQYDRNGKVDDRFNCPNCDAPISLLINGVNAP